MKSLRVGVQPTDSNPKPHALPDELIEIMLINHTIIYYLLAYFEIKYYVYQDSAMEKLLSWLEHIISNDDLRG